MEAYLPTNVSENALNKRFWKTVVFFLKSVSVRRRFLQNTNVQQEILQNPGFRQAVLRIAYFRETFLLNITFQETFLQNRGRFPELPGRKLANLCRQVSHARKKRVQKTFVFALKQTFQNNCNCCPKTNVSEVKKLVCFSPPCPLFPPLAGFEGSVCSAENKHCSLKLISA